MILTMVALGAVRNRIWISSRGRSRQLISGAMRPVCWLYRAVLDKDQRDSNIAGLGVLAQTRRHVGGGCSIFDK